MSEILEITMPKQKQQPEFHLQVLICDYIAKQYPSVLFVSSLAGMKMTMPQAVRMKRIQKDGFCCPDLMILARRGNYGALFLELKKETPFQKNGVLKSNAHLEAQFESLTKLQHAGFRAEFAWDFDGAKKLIDEYLRG